MASSKPKNDDVFDNFQINNLLLYRLPTTGTTLASTDWKDNEFIALREELGCRRSRTSEATGLVAARKFLFWYAGLELPPNEIADCIHALTDRVYIGGAPLILEQFFGSAFPALDISTPKEKDFKLDWAFNYSREKVGDTFKTSLTQVTPAEISKTACSQWFDELLKSLDVNPGTSKAATTAQDNSETTVAYLAFLGLNLLRLATKSPEAVADHITQYTLNSFTSVYGARPPVTSNYSAPPHASTVTQLKLALDGNETLKKRLLYPPIFSYALNLTMTQNIRGFFVASFLLTVNCAGLSVLSWAERAAESLNIDRKTLCEATFTNSTGRFWVEYSKFLTEQENQTSWPFARVFSPSAFAHFAVSRNRAITAIFVAITTGSTKASDPIWQAEHLKTLKSVEISAGIRYSNAAHEHISGPTKYNAKFALGRAIASKMRKSESSDDEGENIERY